MHKQVEWKDHVTEFPSRRILNENPDGTVDVEKAQGEVIQQGTPQSATNFNNLENGTQDAHIGFAIFMQYFMQFDRDTRQTKEDYASEFLNEIKTVTLTNSESYPFNNSQKNVDLEVSRKTMNYDISWEVESADGNVGDVEITEKQLNGFKISFDGSAKNVTLKIRVKGGMLV